MRELAAEVKQRARDRLAAEPDLRPLMAHRLAPAAEAGAL
jgi:hypothetical protein